MNRGVALELDSLRLAHYGNQIPCLICGEGNTPDAGSCRNCYAPMILAHQAQSKNTKPVMFAALGPSGVGKTVYLGMLLDMLSRQPKHLQLAARGGFSVTLQHNTLGALARCEFPSKTPNEPDRWNWVHCQLRSPKHRQPVEMVLPDMAGEALFEEVDHPRSYRVIHSLLSRCDGVMILIDGTKLQSGSIDEDYFTMKLLSHLTELDGDLQEFLGHAPRGVDFQQGRSVRIVLRGSGRLRPAPCARLVANLPAAISAAQVLRGGRGRRLRHPPGARRPASRSCRCASSRAASSSRSNGWSTTCGPDSPAVLASARCEWRRSTQFTPPVRGASLVQIEQAVFTSAKTDRAQGYQLLSRSSALVRGRRPRAVGVGAVARFAAGTAGAS